MDALTRRLRLFVGAVPDSLEIPIGFKAFDRHGAVSAQVLTTFTVE